MIAEGDAGCPAQALADFVDQRVRNIQHQHGIGGKTQRAMVEYQADPTEQPLFLPLAHLREYLVFVGVYPFGEGLIGARHQGQTAFQVSTQGQRLFGIQLRFQGPSPKAKPRSMR
ncbi:hypothetical protein D3C80_1436510 [compost metagenome]